MKLKLIYKEGIIAISFAFVFLASCKDKDVEKLIVPIEKGQLVDKVYPLLDTENSRWFFFSSASRPFGMVNLSPDTEIDGAWGSGYRYNTDTIRGFSHIHAWQISGISVMPVTLSEDNKTTIFSDFYSKFNHDNEVIKAGYHKLILDRYKIKAELTSTKRVGFHKYTFPNHSEKAILLNLNTILGPNNNADGQLKQINDREFVGSIIATPTHRRPKPLKIFFKIELNQSVSSITLDDKTKNNILNLKDFDGELLMKVGISYTSIDNASNNIKTELPHWNFNKTIDDSKQEWEGLLGRIKIEGGTENAQKRFYTDLWHALQGRRIISDVNGAYPDNTGDAFRIGQLPVDASGKPKFNHYNSDSFWGAQWTLNTLWGLVYPEIMEDFVHSMMQYYKDGGLIPRGPSGGNYTFVMTGASSTPFIVSAIQKGIIKDDLEVVYKALKQNHTIEGIMEKAGYEHKTNLGGGLKHYIENGFAPYPIPEGEFGSHQDGASLTMEYAYQDWTLAQLAKKLNHQEDYNYFLNRSKNYKNVFDNSVGWMRPKDINGNWKQDFDPYQVEFGFIESNGAQSTWFVPHDLNGLATLMGGNEKAIEKLNTQFENAEKLNFAAGTSHAVEGHPEYSRIPINFGNQPSIQTSFVFNKLGRPDLTQYWTRKVISKTFSGLATNTGYNGDEDQGLMGSLNVLLKIGLFQMNGGTEENPEYQIGSPIFDKITIKLHPRYYSNEVFTIKTINNSPTNVYINKTTLNNQLVESYNISQNDIVNGGELVLEMTDKTEKH